MSLPITVSVVLIASLHQPGFEQSLDYYKYPNTDLNQNTPNCYAQTNNTRAFDLTRLCGFTPKTSPTGGGYSTSGGTPPSTGVCNTPDDRASNGSRCGGRAASERKGGR
jgi:hypothetical protein